jgi:hypothetical protein
MVGERDAVVERDGAMHVASDYFPPWESAQSETTPSVHESKFEMPDGGASGGVTAKVTATQAVKLWIVSCPFNIDVVAIRLRLTLTSYASCVRLLKICAVTLSWSYLDAELLCAANHRVTSCSFIPCKIVKSSSTNWQPVSVYGRLLTSSYIGSGSCAAGSMPRASSTRRSSSVAIASAGDLASTGDVPPSGSMEGTFNDTFSSCRLSCVWCTRSCAGPARSSLATTAEAVPAPFSRADRGPRGGLVGSTGAYGATSLPVVSGNMPTMGSPLARMLSSYEVAVEPPYKAARRRRRRHRTSIQTSTATIIATAGIPSPSPSPSVSAVCVRVSPTNVLRRCVRRFTEGGWNVGAYT